MQIQIQKSRIILLTLLLEFISETNVVKHLFKYIYLCLMVYISIDNINVRWKMGLRTMQLQTYTVRLVDDTL